MFKLQFVNSVGEEIELFAPPYRLSKVEGLGEVDADLQSQQAPYQDGDILIDVVMQPRHISVELKIYGQDAEDTERKRRRLASVFNPRLRLGKLKYIRGNEIKEISAVAESIPHFPDGPTNRGSTFQKAMIFLKAPNPFWRSTSITEEPAFEPLFQFPFEGEFQMGMQRDQRVIVNDGDAPAPMQIEFFGPAVNPIITNKTTGEYIRVRQTLQEGERMLIDTSIPSVHFVDENGNKQNVFNWIDLNSTFFQLVIGQNDIQYSADSDIQGAIVNISYSKFYAAV